jgi:sRNA-binding carbon storage regulator CsrA
MLVLTRLVGQSIAVNGPCVIQLNWIKGNRACFGFEADGDVKILRTELLSSQLLEKATEPEGSRECGEPGAA